jgi:protease II
MSFQLSPKEITQHGQTRVDNHFWMGYREDPDVLKDLHTKRNYLEEVMRAPGDTTIYSRRSHLNTPS